MSKTNPSPTFPAFPGDAAVVTKSDVTRFAPSVIYVGTTGNVSVVTAENTTIVFTAVPAGAVVPVRVIGVNAATTAADMVRIF